MSSDSGESEYPFYCITQGRCRLCQFNLVEGELIVAAISKNEISSQIAFVRDECFTDDKLQVTIHTCLRRTCSIRDTTTICFHEDCHQSCYHLVTPKFLNVTHPTFVPSAAEQRRRSNNVHQNIVNALQQAFSELPKLPRELWLVIAGLLSRDYTIITAHHQALQAKAGSHQKLDLGKALYASYVKIEDRYYVKDVQHDPSLCTGGAACLLLPRPMEPMDEGHSNMFISEDHIGIRQVVFIPSRNCESWCDSQLSSQDTWWSYRFGKNLGSLIEAKTDGFKVRDVVEWHEPSQLCRVGRQTPTVHDPTFANVKSMASKDNHGEIQFRYFDVWPPDDYFTLVVPKHSVVTDGLRVLAILVYKDTIADTSVDEEAGPAHCFWVQDDQGTTKDFTDFCKKTIRKVTHNRPLGLKFRLANGGARISSEEGVPCFNYHVLSSLPRSCDVYFDALDSPARNGDARLITFNQDVYCSSFAKLSPNVLPNVPRAISQLQKTTGNGVWLHTSCSMMGATSIVLSINKTVALKPITGLQVTYAEDKTERVGQYRPDWVTEPVELDDTEKFYIKTEDFNLPDTGKCSHVTDVRVRRPSDQMDGGCWLEIGQTGILSWWFTELHNVIFYDGNG